MLGLGLWVPSKSLAYFVPNFGFQCLGFAAFAFVPFRARRFEV